MPGAWETQHNVLVGILHVDTVTIAWAFGLRNLIIPGYIPPQPMAGAPFDMARNQLAQQALNVGASHCLRSDCIVETADGGKRVENIVIGDIVKTHLGRFRSVTDIFKRELKSGDPVLWVKTPHSTIKCTPEHPFFVSRGGSLGHFVRAMDLLPDDEILYPDRYTEDWLEFNIRYNTIGVRGDGKKGAVKDGAALGKLPVTRDVARFLGLYLAEGCTCSSGIHITVGNHERYLIDFIVKMSKLLFDRKPTVISRWATTISINVRSLGKLFRSWFGRNAREKHIPAFVFKWNQDNRLSFLRGYLDGDGSVAKGKQKGQDGKLYNKTPVQSFVTASAELSRDILRLSSMSGLQAKTVLVAGGVAIIASTGQEIRSGESIHGWYAKKSSDKILDLLEARRDGDYLHIPVVSIEYHKISRALKDKWVYNLEVEDDHSYIADSTSVHNCFFLDSDIVCPRDTILRLLAHKKPLISGIYFRRSPPAGVPVMQRPPGQWVLQYPKNQLFEVDVVGTGCMLIDCNLLRAMKPVRPGHHWFYWGVDTAEVDPEYKMSEDFNFCLAVKKQLGVPTLVDPSIECRHIGYAQATYGSFVPCEATPIT